MNFKVSSSALYNRLTAASKVMVSKNSMPILDCFLFDIQDGTITITASDSDKRIQSFANAIRMVETFYQKEGLFDVLESEILQRKFLCKSSYVLDKAHRNIWKWAALFPESNGAWHNINYSIPNKMKFLLLEIFVKLFCHKF